MTKLSDRQAASSRQGKEFENLCEHLLLIKRWTIVDRHWRHPVVDVEIDFVAVSPTGQTWWIECKGSWENARDNGLERTSTFKQAIGSAALLRLLEDRCPYMLMTSHPPRDGGCGEVWLNAAIDIYFDEIWVVGSDRKYGGVTS